MSVSSGTSLLKRPKQTAKQNNNRGVALAETLIAMTILTIGMIGLLEMQRQGLWAAIDNHRSIVADILLYDATERMRSNAQDSILFDNGGTTNMLSTDVEQPSRTIENSGYYLPHADTASNSPTDCLNRDCVPNQIANLDVSLWMDNLNKDLNIPKSNVPTENNGAAVICYNDTINNPDMALPSPLDLSANVKWMTCKKSDEIYPIQRYLMPVVQMDFSFTDKNYNRSAEVARSVPNHTIKFQWTNMAGKRQTRATYVVLPALRLDNYRE